MKRPPSFRRSCGLLAMGAASWFSWASGFAADAAPLAAPAGRVTAVFDGITCEFSPGQEELARLMAVRIAAQNRENLATPLAPLVNPETIPLSPEEMRLNRAKYLAAIGAQLALAKPTAWQEECYDAFLNNYETTMRQYVMIRRALEAGLGQLDKITIWERAELVRRLEGGEAITGFSYDPATKKGSANFQLPSINVQDERFKALSAEREQLKHDYRFKITAVGNGEMNYQGHVGGPRSPGTAVPVPAPETKAAKEKAELDFFPLIITAEQAGLPAAELAERLWRGSTQAGMKSVHEGFRKMIQALPRVDPTIAYLVLHEATEIGIVDHYYRGKDRRWLCDGVANYVAWRVVRDRHGPEAAQRVYNLPAQLAKYADLREQADLRQWAAAENQSEEEQESPLNRARYAYATQAVMLMTEQAGPDALPKLFKEIGRTKRDKVTFKTVEQAWRKVGGTKLDNLLEAAEQVTPTPAGQKQEKRMR